MNNPLWSSWWGSFWIYSFADFFEFSLLSFLSPYSLFHGFGWTLCFPSPLEGPWAPTGRIGWAFVHCFHRWFCRRGYQVQTKRAISHLASSFVFPSVPPLPLSVSASIFFPLRTSSYIFRSRFRRQSSSSLSDICAQNTGPKHGEPPPPCCFYLPAGFSISCNYILWKLPNN